MRVSNLKTRKQNKLDIYNKQQDTSTSTLINLQYNPIINLIVPLLILSDMDPRVREVIQTAMNNSAGLLQSMQEISNNKMGSVVDTCFSRNSNNADRFAECFMEKQKKLEDLMKSMQFKILFFSKSSNNCLTVNKRSVSQCVDETTKGLKDVIQNLKKNIEKI